MARLAPARPRAPPLAHAGHRVRHADGFHRGGSGVDGHGAGAAAVGDLRRAADVGRRHTHARPCRAISHVHATVLLPRGDRGLAAVSTNPAESRDAGAERLHGVRERYVTLADLLAGVIFLALNAYALLGGADFGGGVWDLLARGPRTERRRELIAEAIGPVWEANHVWLILALVLLFTCFPPAFARLGTRLHIPLSLVLIGIVLRGSAFTFWRYGGGAHGDREQRHWGVIFAVASLITPLLLGTTVGAIASGAGGDEGRGTGGRGSTRPTSRPGSTRSPSAWGCSRSSPSRSSRRCISRSRRGETGSSPKISAAARSPRARRCSGWPSWPWCCRYATRRSCAT